MRTCIHPKHWQNTAFRGFSTFFAHFSFLTLSTTVAASVYKSKAWLLNFLRRASTKQLGDLLCIDCVRPAGLGFLVATSLLLCTGLDRAQQIDEPPVCDKQSFLHLAKRCYTCHNLLQVEYQFGDLCANCVWPTGLGFFFLMSLPRLVARCRVEELEVIKVYASLATWFCTDPENIQSESNGLKDLNHSSQGARRPLPNASSLLAAMHRKPLPRAETPKTPVQHNDCGMLARLVQVPTLLDGNTRGATVLWCFVLVNILSKDGIQHKDQTKRLHKRMLWLLLRCGCPTGPPSNFGRLPRLAPLLRL